MDMRGGVLFPSQRASALQIVRPSALKKYSHHHKHKEAACITLAPIFPSIRALGATPLCRVRPTACACDSSTTAPNAGAITGRADMSTGSSLPTPSRQRDPQRGRRTRPCCGTSSKPRNSAKTRKSLGTTASPFRAAFRRGLPPSFLFHVEYLLRAQLATRSPHASWRVTRCQSCS